METRHTPLIGHFPMRRMRRNRQSRWVRRLTEETTLNVSDLIWPVFVAQDSHANTEIPSMPGVYRSSIEALSRDAEESAKIGIPCMAIFPFVEPESKNDAGDESLNPDNLVCRAVRAVKKAVPEMGIITDVALDPYTSHGHDGILRDGTILNDETVRILCKQAVNQAAAGSDAVAPSDMMDGRIGAIRQELDQHGFHNVIIMSYAAKYQSSFYGPFRDAIGSKRLLKGDKSTYQMNPANSNEALHEVALDLDEGADMVIVKPGMPYLDVCRRVKDEFKVPTFAYQTSGEYAMLVAASQRSWLDMDRAVMESLLSFKRAGCDGIFTYSAMTAARIISSRSP